MKRIAVSTMFLLVLLFIIILPVYADELSSVTAVVNSDKLVTVSGRIDGGAGKTVNIMVCDPDGSLDYLNTCLSGPGGLFRVSYTMSNTETGLYTVTVGTAGSANVAVTSFIFRPDSLDVAAVLENGLVKISGINGAGAGRIVTVRITDPNGAEEYNGLTMSGTGGAFSISYAFTNTQAGKYTVRVGASGAEEPAVCFFLAGVQTEVTAGIDKQKLVTIDAVTSVPERPVSVRITDPTGNTEYMTSIITKEDGTFTLSYTMENETKGNYRVSVSAKGFETPVTTEFFHGTGLSGLTLSSGSLNPKFKPDVLSYSAVVENSTASVRVTPVAINPASVITVNGTNVASGTASGVISLNEGLNTIRVAVTEKDMTVTTYVISVRRIAPDPVLSDNNKLSDIRLTGASLNESFSPVSLRYSANVPDTTVSVTVTPFAADSSSTVEVNGAMVASGKASQAIMLETGENTINIKVTAQDGTLRTYTITVIRASSANANLSRITLSTGSLNEVFNANTTAYTMNVPNSVTSLTVTPVPADSKAAVVVNGGANLAVGENIITITVTAQDETTVKTYIITVTRAKSGNADLNNLVISEGSFFRPSQFFPTNTTYEINVSNYTETMTVTPETAEPDASVTVNGGPASNPVNLNFGLNQIDVMVTAPNGINTKTYTLIITRPESTDNTLSALTVSSGVLNPVFSPTTAEYTVYVDNSVSNITLTPVVNNRYATVTVDGNSVTSGSASAPISLAAGSSRIVTVRVKPQSLGQYKNYTVTVTRAPSSNANLSGLSISEGSLSFNADTLSYELSVDNSVTKLRVTPTTADTGAKVRVNGTVVTSGSASEEISLATGQNTINVEVTAQDNITVKTYVLKIMRKFSKNADLSGINFNTGNLNEEFKANTTAYTMNVPNSVTSLMVTPVPADSTAEVAVNGGANLAVGENIITITVTAEDKTTVKTYTITVTRARSANANLSKITLSTGSLNEVFNANTTAYTMNVPNSVTSLTVTPETEDSTASVSVPGGSALVTGENTITITVTAQDETTIKTYTITVTRAKSGNADLSSLEIGEQSINLDASVNYSINVENETDAVTVIPTAADSAAKKIEVNGEEVLSGSVSGSISLNVGPNTIIIVVTAENDTTRTYTITVTRALSGNADLSGITLSNGNLSPAFAADVIDYTVEVAHEINSITVTTNTANSAATISVIHNSIGIGGSGVYTLGLNVGDDNVTSIEVTAQNGNKKTYIITTKRAGSDNAYLKALSVVKWPMNPSFDREITNYAIEIYRDTESIQLYAEADDSNAGVKINGGTELVVNLDLSKKSENITVSVTAENGITVKDYIITVNRSDTAEPRYIIYTSNLGYGSITADKANAVAGDTVELTITPNEGYQLEEGTLRYIYTKEDGFQVEYFISGTTFIMPAANVAIWANFVEVTY